MNDDIIEKIENLQINNEKKQMLKEVFLYERSPYKIKVEKLPKIVKDFLYRDKNYYKHLENELKQSNSKLEMIKKFLNELFLRAKTQDLNKNRFETIIKGDFFSSDGKERIFKIGLKNCSIDEKDFFYFSNFNPFLYQRFFFDYLAENEYFPNFSKINVLYSLDVDFLNFQIKNEKFNLKLYEDFVLSNGRLEKSRLDILDKVRKNNKNFLVKIGFYDFVDNIQNIDEKIEYINEGFNLLETLYTFCSFGDLKNAIRNIKKSNLDDFIKDKIIDFLIDLGAYRQIISFKDSVYPDTKKFYLEIDFSIPEDLFLEQIKELYKAYKRGDIQTFEEFAKNKKIKKYDKVNSLQNNYIFKIKDEKNIPLYVKLADLVYILDLWLLNVKNIFMIRQIESNRLNYENSFKDFSPTFKKYKKFISEFYITKEFMDFI